MHQYFIYFKSITVVKPSALYFCNSHKKRLTFNKRKTCKESINTSESPALFPSLKSFILQCYQSQNLYIYIYTYTYIYNNNNDMDERNSKVQITIKGEGRLHKNSYRQRGVISDDLHLSILHFLVYRVFSLKTLCSVLYSA